MTCVTTHEVPSGSDDGIIRDQDIRSVQYRNSNVNPLVGNLQ